MTTLTLVLPLVRPTAGSEFSYVLSDDGRSVAGQGSAALALLPRADSLVLAVPPRALSWHVVKLPPMAAARQRAALEGLLEDRLLDEPATLALAVSTRRRPDGSTLVAACDKDWLAAALHFFEQSGRPANRVVPQLPPQADAESGGMSLVASGTQEEAWLTVADHDGVVCVPLAQAHSLLSGGGPDLQAATLVAEPAVADMAERQVGRPAVIRSVADGLLAGSQSDWELAQFDLAISSGGRLARRWALGWAQFARAPAWRMARWGLALLALANIVGLNAWAWHLERTVASKKLQVRQVLTQTFPSVKTVVDVPLQMERQMALLRQSSGAVSARDLEPMLSAAGSVLPDGLTPGGLDYSAGQLVVKGSLLSPAQAELVAGKLSALGYVAQIEGERLTLRAGGRP
jgi:general secretion pathway protein L